MRTHFIYIGNLQELKTFMKSLYITTVSRFKERLTRYNHELVHLSTEYSRKKELEYLIRELDDTITQLDEKPFMNTFIKWVMDFCEQIRYINVSKHTEQCVCRAVFDIVFKYTFDIEYKISHGCCSTDSFKFLQFELLRDSRWKIIN